MRKLRWVVWAVVLTGMFLSGCGSTNPYMKRGTDQYNRVTYNMLGEWQIASYTIKGAETIGTRFKSGKAIFEDIEPGNRHGTVKLILTLKDDQVKERAKEWANKWPDVKVDRYDVLVQARWLLHRNGDMLYLQDPLVGADITGSGKNLPAVLSSENAKLASTSIASGSGGHEGFIAGQILKSTTRVNSIYPEIAPQNRFKLGDATLKTNSTQRIDFALKR